MAICDDEKIIRERITDLINKQGADCRIENFDTGDELLVAGKHFDIIFLDIQMEDINGIETARAIREYDRKAVIVFVTAMTEAIHKSILDTEANYHFIGQSQAVAAAVTAYESAVSTFSNSVMENL